MFQPNITVHVGEFVLPMVSRGVHTCRCGAEFTIAILPDEPGVGAILHALPTCPPYDRLGIRDFYDYLRSGREPAPIAASGETPRPSRRPR